MKLGVSLMVLSGIFAGARVKAISVPDLRPRCFFGIVLPQNALDPFLSAGWSLGRTLSEAVPPPQQFQQIRLAWRLLLRDDGHR